MDRVSAKRSSSYLALAVTMAAICQGGVAHAQDGAGQVENEYLGEDQSSSGLGTIIVTAQKRSQNLQEVPIAVQAFSGEALTDSGVQKASDIVGLAPNISLAAQNPTNVNINIRGVGTVDFFGNAQGAVGLYLDEVTLSAPYLSGIGLFDIERVEVLRGPQNSLFGRNTTGGAINYLTRAPSLNGEADGHFAITYGRFDRFDIEGAADIEFGDTIAARIAGKFSGRDGIWNNVDTGESYGEKDRQSLRGTLVWEPGDATKITANLHWAKERSEIDPFRHVGGRAGDGRFVGQTPLAGTQIDFKNGDFDTVNSQGIDPSRPRWRDVVRTGSNRQHLDIYGGYLKVEHDLGFADFTSISSYDNTDIQFSLDIGGSGNSSGVIAGLIDQDQKYKQWTQELRLASSGSGPFRWIGGLYLFNEDAILGQNIRFGDGQIISSPNTSGDVPGGPPVLVGGSFAIWALSQGFATGFPGAGFVNNISYTIGSTENFVWSPYARGELDITDKLTFTAGVRYTHDKKELPSLELGLLDDSLVPIDTFFSNEVIREQTANQALGACVGDGRRCASTITDDDVVTKEFGYNFVLDYQANDDLLLFASYGRGFRSGKHDIEFFHGPQTGFIRENQTAEKLDAFEVGLKSTLFNDTLRFNASAFFSIWRDQQTFFVDPARGPTFVNIPRSEIKGFELETTWAPTSTTTIQASLGILDTEVTEDSPLPIDTVGHELSLSPKTSGNLTGIQRFYIGENELSLQASYSYKSSPKSNLRDVDLIDELGDQNIVSARIGYEFGENGQYEIALAGENLLASKYCHFKFDLTVITGAAYCVASEGTAFWNVSGRVRF